MPHTKKQSMKSNLDIDNVIIELISARLKNLVSPLDIIKWLGNFEKNELRYAIAIASNLTVYTSYEIEESLNCSFNKTFNTINENDKIIVNPIGKFGKSGSMISYYFQKTDFYRNHKKNIALVASLSNLTLDKNNNNYLVLIDDFIGSGKSVEKYCKEIDSICTIKNEQRFLISVAGMQKGIKNLKPHFERIEIEASNIFKMAFSGNSNYFGYRKHQPYRTFAYKYGKILSSNTNKKGKPVKYFNALGFGNSQALVSFVHGSPNNTLPIIWSNKNGWFPLIPRFSQDKMTVSREFRKHMSYELSILKEFGSDNIQKVFFTYKIKKGNRQFSSVGKIDFSIYTIIKLMRTRYSTVSICQKLGILISDFEIIVKDGKKRGVFDDEGQLTTFGLKIYYDAKKCIEKRKRSFDYESRDKYEIREINYKPRTFNGKF